MIKISKSSLWWILNFVSWVKNPIGFWSQFSAKFYDLKSW